MRGRICDRCRRDSESIAGAVLRFEHVGKWSPRGRREVASANLRLCPTCSDLALKHLKRMFGVAMLGVEKQSRLPRVVPVTV